MTMLDDLKNEEAQLETECREWAEKRNAKNS